MLIVLSDTVTTKAAPLGIFMKLEPLEIRLKKIDANMHNFALKTYPQPEVTYYEISNKNEQKKLQKKLPTRSN